MWGKEQGLPQYEIGNKTNDGKYQYFDEVSFVFFFQKEVQKGYRTKNEKNVLTLNDAQRQQCKCPIASFDVKEINQSGKENGHGFGQWVECKIKGAERQQINRSTEKRHHNTKLVEKQYFEGQKCRQYDEYIIEQQGIEQYLFLLNVVGVCNWVVVNQSNLIHQVNGVCG